MRRSWKANILHPYPTRPIIDENRKHTLPGIRLSLKRVAAIMSSNPFCIFMRFRAGAPPRTAILAAAQERVSGLQTGKARGSSPVVLSLGWSTGHMPVTEDFQHSTPVSIPFLKGPCVLMFRDGSLRRAGRAAGWWQAVWPHGAQPSGQLGKGTLGASGC